VDFNAFGLFCLQLFIPAVASATAFLIVFAVILALVEQFAEVGSVIENS